MEKNKENKFHKIFKLIIIIIVLIFIGLIYYFLKLQLTTSSDDYLDYLFEYNRDKYVYFENEDKVFKYNNALNNVEECSFNNPIEFYTKYVIKSKPCVLRASSSHSEQLSVQFQTILDNSKELTQLTRSYVSSKDYIPYGNITSCGKAESLIKEPFFTKYQKINKKLFITGTRDFESKNFLNQFDHIIMAVEGDVVFRISPPSQINNLSPFRNSSTQKDFWDFNTVYSRNNFFGLEEKHKKENEKVNILSTKLHTKDILYIPGFFFVQYRITTDTMLSMMWDYKCNSRILKTMFKVLFDDNVGDEDIFE